MVTEEYKELSIREQCIVLGVARSTYYYEAKQESAQNVELANLIYELWIKYPFFGYRRITQMLRQQGYGVNYKRIQRLMQEMNLQALYPKPKLSKSNKEHVKYPYLLENLEIKRANQVWATDITYIGLGNGFVYLLVIIDLHSRYIVGATLSISLEVEDFIGVLEEAIKKYGVPEILNSDQGSQFTSSIWTTVLIVNGIRISMDGKGRCFDNIIAERFWWTVKYEEVYLKSYEDVVEARISIMKFIEFYNCIRPHQSLGYMVPKKVYEGSKNNLQSDKKAIKICTTIN